MEYTKKDIITGKPGNVIGFVITLALFGYALLAQFGIVDIEWVRDYFPNMTADTSELLLPVLIVTGLSFLMALLLMGSDLSLSAGIKKSLAEYGEDDVLDQMNGHAVYVFSVGNTPKFFVTEKYIVAKNQFVCYSKDVSWIYLQTYKSTRRFIVRLRNNKELIAGGDIPMKGKTKECADAMRKVCPGLLIGDTKENREEHKARVKLEKGKD